MKIYVGNLSFDIVVSDLGLAFGEFGQVTSINILKDKQTGQSKGFGFVEMAEVSEGQAAINQRGLPAGCAFRYIRGDSQQFLKASNIIKKTRIF